MSEAKFQTKKTLKDQEKKLKRNGPEEISISVNVLAAAGPTKQQGVLTKKKRKHEM